MNVKIVHATKIIDKKSIISSKDLSIDDCKLLTKEEVSHVNKKNVSSIIYKNRFFEHEDFKTVKQYINNYKNKGYYFVDIS